MQTLVHDQINQETCKAVEKQTKSGCAWWYQMFTGMGIPKRRRLMMQWLYKYK